MATRQRTLMLWAICAATLACGTNGAAGQEAAGEPIIGEMFVQTIPARHYLHASLETEFATMGQPLGEKITALLEAAREAKLVQSGALVHVYFGAPHRQPEIKFRMETGFFVPEGTPAMGEFQVRELPSQRCASVIYVGPVTRLGEAWQTLYGAVHASGLTPTDDERELALYWESPESANNVFQVQLGVE